MSPSPRTAQEQVDDMIAKLHQSRAQLLARGVSERRIVYVVRNGGSNPRDARLGSFFETLEGAEDLCRSTWNVRYVHPTQNVYETRAVDGADHALLLSLLSEIDQGDLDRTPACQVLPGEPPVASGSQEPLAAQLAALSVA